MPAYWQGDHYLQHMEKAKIAYEESLSKEYKRWRSIKWHIQTKGTYYLAIGTIGYGTYLMSMEIILISILLVNINWNINKRADNEGSYIL